MLPGQDAESERIRSCSGICELLHSQAHDCMGVSMFVSTLIELVGTPATRR